MDEIRDLTDRMRLLETKYRWRTRFTGSLVLALAVTLVMGQEAAQKPTEPLQNEVRAKRFVLVDDDGDCRASLGFIPGRKVHGRSVPGFESAVLSLFAKSNKTAITLMVMHDGRPAMMLNGKDGKSRIMARLLPDGNPAVWFMDDDKKDRLKLSLEADGRPSILFKDKDGRETNSLPPRAGK